MRKSISKLEQRFNLYLKRQKLNKRCVVKICFKQLLILLLINSSPPAKSGEVVESRRGSTTTVHLEKRIQERKEKSWEENN